MKSYFLFVIGCVAAIAQDAALAPVLKHQFFDASGRPLSGGTISTYASGTMTPVATYTDYTAAHANANPIVLDSAGRASIWFAAPPISGFTLSSAGAGATVTVAGYTVKASDPGALILISSGTNFVRGQHRILTADAGAGTWTFSDSATTGVGSGGTGSALVGAYKLVAKNSAGVPQWTVDGVADIGQLLKQDLADASAEHGAALVAFDPYDHATGRTVADFASSEYGDSLVITKQSGTGAVARTVRQALNETVKVSQYASCNGVADDTLGAQEALDKVPTGGLLIIPAGCTIPSGLSTLTTSDATAVVLDVRGAFDLWAKSGTTALVKKVSLLLPYLVGDLTITGNLSAVAGAFSGDVASSGVVFSPVAILPSATSGIGRVLRFTGDSVHGLCSGSGTAETLCYSNGSTWLPVLVPDSSGIVLLAFPQMVAVASTGLPTCNAGTLGMHATVNDADTPSIGVTLTGAGGSPASVWCNGSTWTITGI